MKRSPNLKRSGFTLVELLVVITVIGILVGMLIVTIGPVITRASEFAIHNESTLISGGVEKFTTKYGVHPPSFDDPATPNDEGISNPDELLPYITRIAPNHNEAEIVGPGPLRRIDVWWMEVGAQIGTTPGADLVFWLSGILKNKQFPVTGGQPTGSMPVAYNFSALVDGTIVSPAIEREVNYDFDKGRLGFFDVTNGTFTPTSDAAPLAVAGFKQPRGKDAVFLYRDHTNYWDDTIGAFPGEVEPGEAGAIGMLTTAGFAYYDGNKVTLGTNAFENPESFQIVTTGVDGQAYDSATADPNDWTQMDNFSRDNITNFSTGRLEKMTTR